MNSNDARQPHRHRHRPPGSHAVAEGADQGPHSLEPVPATHVSSQATQLGPLPEEWRGVRLGEIVSLERGISWSKADENAEGIGVLSIPNIGKDGRIWLVPRVRVLKSVHPEKLLAKDDVLLVGSSGSVANVGRLGVIDGDTSEPLTFASFTVRVRAHSPWLEQSFLWFLLRSHWIDFSQLSKRAADGKYNLQMQQLRDYFIPLPPLPEQRAIAYVLGVVQRARETTERVIAATRELKKSLMRHLFTYGPVPVGATHASPLQDTDIGPIPAHWRVVRLGEVGEIITGKTPSTNEARYWDGTIPFITPADLSEGEIYTTERTITEEGLAQVKAVPQGAVLVSCIGYIGKVGMVGVKIAATNQQINSIIPNVEVIEPLFLFYALQTDGTQRMLNQLTRKTTVPILNKTNFSKANIPLPPLSEQREIARILQAVDRKLAAEEARRQVLEALFKTLLHDLMTARRRLPADYVAQFATRSHGLAPQPTDTTHGG